MISSLIFGREIWLHNTSRMLTEEVGKPMLYYNVELPVALKILRF